MKKILLAIPIISFVIACAEPIPIQKLDYVGHWENDEVLLIIRADGTVSYIRAKNGRSTSINAPLREFIGDDFVVGFSFMTTTFKVSESPFKVDGK